MDAYDRCTNLGKKFLPILLPSMVEAKNVSDYTRSNLIVMKGTENVKQATIPSFHTQ